MNAEYWIEQLDLLPHPEGGYFRETYRSTDTVLPEGLPERFRTDHSLSTAIYFLLKHDSPSRLHQLAADETWHFYDGSSLMLHLINLEGEYRQVRLGRDSEREEVFQYTVLAGTWFGATVDKEDGYTLVGCTVAPGFEFNDFKLGKRSELFKLFPKHKNIIEDLTLSERT